MYQFWEGNIFGQLKKKSNINQHPHCAREKRADIQWWIRHKLCLFGKKVFLFQFFAWPNL